MGWLNEDIMYEVFQYSTLLAEYDAARREDLFSFSLVCTSWCHAAQSTLFRDVFLQIRSSMLSLLNIISYSNPRGKRLASYIRTLDVRLSKYPEAYDPPPLPMIHPRHLAGLLAHLTGLEELRITIGGEFFLRRELREVAAVSRRLRVLRLKGFYSCLYMFNGAFSLWPHLDTLHFCDGAGPQEESPFDYREWPSPSFRLRRFSLETPYAMDFEGVLWILHSSADTLSHLSMTPQWLWRTSPRDSPILAHLRALKSLTLQNPTWSRQLVEALHAAPSTLRELRLMSSVRVRCSFPDGVPSSVEHLLCGTMQRMGGELTMFRPDKLRRFTYDASAEKSYWVTQYEADCLKFGIEVVGLIMSPRIDATFTPSIVPYHRGNSDITVPSPTPSQLDLSTFADIYCSKSVDSRRGSIITNLNKAVFRMASFLP